MKNKHVIKIIICIFITVTFAVDNIFAEEPVQGTQDKPNIIFILLDDLGWKDVGFMGNRFIETPTLDQLASEGMVFTNAYSNAPNCAPSRAAIMTGLYAPRTEVYTMFSGDMGEPHLRAVLTPENKMYLEPKFVTIAEVLQQNGYSTAHIGKWNLGTGKVRGPEGQGFVTNIAGFRGGTPPNGYFAPYDLPGLETAPPGEYLTDRLSAEAVQFIEQNKHKPFFIYLSHFAPHYPLEAPELLEKKYYEKKAKPEFSSTIHFPPYAAMIDSVDQGVRTILRSLEEHQLIDNTLIIFTADNGGYHHTSDMGGLRGGKSSLYEGGIRIPLFFWWPKKIQAAASAEPVIGTDFFPTLLNIIGASSSGLHLDGESLLPLLLGKRQQLTRQNIYWYFPAYTVEGSGNLDEQPFQQRPAVVIRQQQWKLIRYLDNSPIELYNLRQDPGENNNLAANQPDTTQRLDRELQQWLTDVKAPLPLPANPAYQSNSVSIPERLLEKIKALLGLGS